MLYYVRSLIDCLHARLGLKGLSQTITHYTTTQLSFWSPFSTNLRNTKADQKSVVNVSRMLGWGWILKVGIVPDLFEALSLVDLLQFERSLYCIIHSESTQSFHPIFVSMDKAPRVISDHLESSVLQASLYYYMIINRLESLEAPLNSLD